ncbi:MAG: hypothetical protein ACE5FC_07075, partial [Myxococcota bacterium]
MSVPEMEKEVPRPVASQPQAGTELSTDGVVLVLKFVESHLTPDELRFYQGLKPGEYVLLSKILPIWEGLTRRIPGQMKAAVKGMIYRT